MPSSNLLEEVPHLLSFNDKNELLVADKSGHLSLFKLSQDDDEQVKMLWTIDALQFDLKQGLSHILLDSDFCVMADHANKLLVYDITKARSPCPAYTSCKKTAVIFQKYQQTAVKVVIFNF